MAERDLLTREDLIVIGKLITEHNNLTNTTSQSITDGCSVRVQVSLEPGRPHTTVAQMSGADYKSIFASRNEARAAVIRDQLLEYGVKVD